MEGTCLYLGRLTRYGGPHYFANPYKIPKDGTRDEVLEKYRPHLAGLLATERGQAELDKVRQQVAAGLPLGCHCAGEDGTPEVLTAEDELFCHGQIVLMALGPQESGYEEPF